MSESLSRKIKKSFVRTSLALCTLFAIAVTMAGCGDGDSADGSTPAKYFRYEKKGNVKDGEYIVIYGLNTVSDEKGNLKVNLNDIWTKYQGKIVFPSQIDGFPVRKIDISRANAIKNIADKVPNSNVYLVNAADRSKLFYVAADEYNKLVSEVVVPEGIEKYDLYDWDDVKTLTIPLSNVAGGYSCDHVIVVQGSSTVDKLPEDKRMLFYLQNKVTLPDCVRIIDLSHFSNSKELFCSKEAEYSYEGKYTSKNPKEVMAKVDEYHQGPYKKLTINGMKILD